MLIEVQSMNNVRNLSRDTVRRIRLLRNNVIDLSIALDDLDAELAPRLQERAELARLLDEAQRELQLLLERAA